MVLPNQIDVKDVIELRKEMFKARYCKAVVVNKNIKTIPYQCFQSSHIEKIILPEGLEAISSDASYWNEAGKGETVDITFIAPAGSKVEQYAKDRGFKFEALD